MGKSSGYSRGVSSGEGEDSPPKALAPASAADAVDELVEAEVSRQRELQVADAGARESPGRRLCRLRVAKFVLVATGVWWGVCMQLIYYQGGGNEMTQLPNVDWYLGMMLVYAGRIFKRGRPEGVADVSQRHILPIAVCDFLGTVGTTIGLELAGSAIFGIIFASVTVWSALFAYAVLGRPQSMLQMAGIGCVVIGLSLPAMERWQTHRCPPPPHRNHSPLPPDAAALPQQPRPAAGRRAPPRLPAHTPPSRHHPPSPSPAHPSTTQ